MENLKKRGVHVSRLGGASYRPTQNGELFVHLGRSTKQMFHTQHQPGSASSLLHPLHSFTHAGFIFDAHRNGLRKQKKTVVKSHYNFYSEQTKKKH